MRRTTLLVSFALAGCFNPESPDVDLTLTDGDMTESGSMTTSTPTGSSAATMNDTDEPTETTTESPTTTGGGSVCGDGTVDADEECDDGVNDGSYGGCLEDCSGPAARCGDNEINGPEVCDDGVNDGSYGGCAADCGTLGGYCGDGTTNGPEGCDEGDNNENGSGCNVDCVISGSSVALYEVGALSFCDGQFLTEPAIRDDGNLLVAATGYCDQDSVILAELDSDLVLQQDFGESLLLPETPVRQGTLLGDGWLLASYGCNYVISPAGALTEVCDPARIHGEYFLQGVADDEYTAIDYEGVARFGAGSPSLGDTPTWFAAPQDNATFDWTYTEGDAGPANSTIVGGYRRTLSNGVYAGYLALFTAGGNLADSLAETRVEFIYGVYRSPDDTIVAWGTSPSPRLFKYDANFADVWDVPLPSANIGEVAIDSVGDILIVYSDGVETLLRKLDASGNVIKWTSGAEEAYDYRLAIDETDHVYVACVGYDGSYFLSVEKFAP